MFTQGNWKVCNGKDVFTDRHPLGVGDIQICDCGVHQVILDTDVELPTEEMESNARLIAASPKLYEACKKTEKILSCGESLGCAWINEKDFDEILEALKEAIALVEKEA